MSGISFMKKGLSTFSLKILACVFMLIDHIGMLLLPQVEVLRVIGRLAFPLFAYFIAEGSRYTRNKLKRLLTIAVLGVFYELVFVLFMGYFIGNIMLTFTGSIILICLLDHTKKKFVENSRLGYAYLLLFVFNLAGAYVVCKLIGVDYGFFGMITPVLAVAFDDMGEWSDKLYSVIGRKYVSLFMFSLGLILVAIFEVELECQIFSLFSVLLLLLYNGERGKYSFKYGFYLFYPLHFLVIQAIMFVVFK